MAFKPVKCIICKLWNVDRDAEYIGLWGDGKLSPICQNCKDSGAGRGNGTYTPDPIR